MRTQVALLTLALTMAACETYSSTGQDANAYAGGSDSSSDSSDPAIVRFQATKAVISSKCLSCHAAGSGVKDFGWTESYTEQQWVASGYVVAGNPSSSSLFTALKNPAGGGGDMPYGGTLTQSQYDAIQEWITKLTP